MIKIVLVIAARPNFMKVAPLIWRYQTSLELKKKFKLILVHAGQHYDESLSGKFLSSLKIPNPDHLFRLTSTTPCSQISEIIRNFDLVFQKESPDTVVVVGDVNATLACAIAAKKSDISLVHVEAGLRSFNRSMPEEINRIAVDHLSDLLLTTCNEANVQLRSEGVDIGRVSKIGNLMIDTLFAFKNKFSSKTTFEIGANSFLKGSFSLLTLHRPSNVDQKENLELLLNRVREVSEKIPVLFPCHPRTLKKLEEFNLNKVFGSNRFLFLTPFSYEQMVEAMILSKFVMTDSGGIQEETTALNIPCLTMRSDSERMITVTEGSNELVGSDGASLMKFVTQILNGRYKKGTPPSEWDGRAAERFWEYISRWAVENNKDRGIIESKNMKVAVNE